MTERPILFSAPMVRAILAEFRPGVYRHYKGGLYTAFALGRHHETGRTLVLYKSHERGTVNVRPLVGWPDDPDGWTVPVVLEPKSGERHMVPRFSFVSCESESLEKLKQENEQLRAQIEAIRRGT